MRSENSQLRRQLAELEQHQTGLEQQVSEHEQELNTLREYFQEKVKFTENMYSEEIRRLIQQQAGRPESESESESAAVDPASGDGLGDLAELGGTLTDLGLPDGAADSAGPSILRLRVEFERRLAALRQQLDRRVAARTGEPPRGTGAEAPSGGQGAGEEAPHAAGADRRTVTIRRSWKAGKRESEKQISEMRSQLMQQHQEELRRLALKHRRRQSSRPRDGHGGGDGAGDAGAGDTGAGEGSSSPGEAEDSRRQALLAELENLSFEMKRQNESEQEAFLEQQRVSLERFARQQERAMRQLEARQQAARDEAAQAERELVTLRAQSAEAEIRRDQEAARWKLELATGYETQIKAVLAGVTLDEETAASVSQLRATLQRDSGAALAELESAHQAALRALEARHERQQRELRLQLEAASRRERHLQDTLSDEVEALRARLAAGPGPAGEGLTFELDGLRLHLLQLEQARDRLNGAADWSAGEHGGGATVEVARDELELLHKDREEQADQLQRLGGLVRALCQYYQTAERLHGPAPPAGVSADPEADATDRMVLEALAPDEAVCLWAERGHQLPRVQRSVREATARLQTAAAAAAAGGQEQRTEREAERAERAERRAAELDRRVEGLTAELTAARQRVAALEDRAQSEEREALGESRPAGQPAPPPPEVTLQCIREAAEALLSAPADPADSRLLLSRVHQLEALLSELTAQSDQMVADCNREVEDVKEQMAAADKQLRSTRAFLDEVTAEREAERDEFGRETARLAELVAARERERDEQALRRRQLEAVEAQNAELMAAAHEGDQERVRLRDELKAAVNKIHDLRDIIRSLESHVDELGSAEGGAAADRLREELHRQTAHSRRLQAQLSECRCTAGRPDPAGADGATPPPRLNSTADSEDTTTLSVCPSLLQELRDQIIRMEADVDQRVETLENSFSSATETLSPAGSRQDLTQRPAGEDLAGLRHKLERLVSVEEAALARIRHLETELSRARVSQQDLVSERGQLQQQLADQLLQLSALRARLERSRLAAEVGTDPGQPSRARLAYLQAELDSAAKLAKAKEKQLADLSCQLDETRRKLIVRESELARLERETERERTPRTSPAASPRDAAELRTLRVKYRELQVAGRMTSPSPPSSPPPPPPSSGRSVHLLALRNPSSVSDPRGWGLSGDERRLHMGRVVSDQLTSGDGNEFGERHAVKMTNRMRSVDSVTDQRAWSLDPSERRRFMSETIRRPPVASTTDHESLFNMIGQWVSSSSADARGWTERAADERHRYLSSVASGALPVGGGQELGDSLVAEQANRLRSAASLSDQRAWSLNADQRRSYMLDAIRRSPIASPTEDLQHQELMAQLRENNLPEFVERLLSDKNVQIDELEQNVRTLTQLSMRSSSAGDSRSSGHQSGVSRLSDPHQPSPEVLRRAATSTQSDPAGDLSLPDISMVQQKQEKSGRPASSPATVPARPDSPTAGSEHSWDSAPTVAGGASQHGSSAGSELASVAGSSASGDSIHNLRAALARKKQLLNARKEQLERSARGEDVEQTPREQSGEAPVMESTPPQVQPSDAELAEAAHVRQQLLKLRARLEVLDPILTRLDEDYASSAGRLSRQKAAPAASETELQLAAQVAEMRRTIEGQDGERRRLEEELQQLGAQGVPETEPRRRQLEEQLLVTLRDMEINKLDACSKMHEASALLARSQRHAHQEEPDRRGPDSEPASSGYMSEMPETAVSPADRSLPPHSEARSVPHSSPRSVPHSPPFSTSSTPLHSPRSSERQPSYRSAYQSVYQDEATETGDESAFESGTERAGSTCGAGIDSQSSCRSLLDETLEQSCRAQSAELAELRATLQSREHNEAQLRANLQSRERNEAELRANLQTREQTEAQLRVTLQSREQSEAELQRQARDREESERLLTARLQTAETELARRDEQLRQTAGQLTDTERQLQGRLAEAERTAAEREEHARDLSARVESLQKEAATAERRRRQLQKKVTSLEEAVGERDTQAERLRERAEELERAAGERDRHVDRLVAQVNSLETELRQRQAEVDRLTAAVADAAERRQSSRRLTRSRRSGAEAESDRSVTPLPEPELTRRAECARPESASSLSDLTAAPTSELDSSQSVTLSGAGAALDSSQSVTLIENGPERDPGPGPNTDALWQQRCESLQQRCHQLSTGWRHEQRRRRQLETRLTALLEPQETEQTERETPRRLQTLLDRVHREGIEVLTLSELRYVRRHSPALLAPDSGGGGDSSAGSEPTNGGPAQTEHDLRQKVELLEWRLREERALVDTLQGWLQSEHQSKLRITSGRLQAEQWPAAAALTEHQDQQQQQRRANGRRSPAPPQQQERQPPSPAPLPPPVLVPPPPALDGSGDGPQRPAEPPAAEQLVQLRRQLSAEQLQRRRLLAELETERSAAAQQRLQAHRLQTQLTAANTELEALRAQLAEKTTELAALRDRLKRKAAAAGGGGGGSSQPPVRRKPEQMAGLADMNAEVDRLRSRVSELERELGQRGDAPCADSGPWRSRLEQERAAWSQERQRLQQRIARLDTEQERVRRAPAVGDGDDERLQYAYGRFLRAESYRRALCWQKRYLMVLLGGYQETEVLTLRRMTELTGGAFRTDARRYLPPAAKFRAAVWVAVAVRRMNFMVGRWKSGRRAAGALAGAVDRPLSPAARPHSSLSLVSASSCDAHAELDRLGRIVRECPRSVPDVQFDVRSVVSGSDICSEDLQPYLERFDALLDRQGLPPQPGRRPDSGR
ncbi:Pericentrin [Amphibalanus amphitrite]|uniref:Pericentrin n=2 Tax=Amphibalanus amphitrite TaxID=1232801 RepID=A0A6A4W8N8_AMPAM|nr:Pericentrin [Amphibalanus amphitrite]